MSTLHSEAAAQWFKNAAPQNNILLPCRLLQVFKSPFVMSKLIDMKGESSWRLQGKHRLLHWTNVTSAVIVQQCLPRRLKHSRCSATSSVSHWLLCFARRLSSFYFTSTVSEINILVQFWVFREQNTSVHVQFMITRFPFFCFVFTSTKQKPNQNVVPCLSSTNLVNKANSNFEIIPLCLDSAGLWTSTGPRAATRLCLSPCCPCWGRATWFWRPSPSSPHPGSMPGTCLSTPGRRSGWPSWTLRTAGAAKRRLRSSRLCVASTQPCARCTPPPSSISSCTSAVAAPTGPRAMNTSDSNSASRSWSATWSRGRCTATSSRPSTCWAACQTTKWIRWASCSTAPSPSPRYCSCD